MAHGRPFRREAAVIDAVTHSGKCPHTGTGTSHPELVTRLLDMLKPDDQMIITMLDLGYANHWLRSQN